MERTKNWMPDEISAACKAYSAATKKSVQGDDMRVEDFKNCVIQKLIVFSPPSPVEGTYFMRASPFFLYS